MNLTCVRLTRNHPGQTGAPIAQANLKLNTLLRMTDLLASTSQVLRLPLCNTTPSPPLMIPFSNFYFVIIIDSQEVAKIVQISHEHLDMWLYFIHLWKTWKSILVQGIYIYVEEWGLGVCIGICVCVRAHMNAQMWISLCISVSGCRQGVSVYLCLWVGIGRGCLWRCMYIYRCGYTQKEVIS